MHLQKVIRILLETLASFVGCDDFKSSGYRCGPCVEFGLLSTVTIERICGVIAKLRVYGTLAFVLPHLVAPIRAVKFSTANGHGVGFQFAILVEYGGTSTPAFAFHGCVAH